MHRRIILRFGAAVAGALALMLIVGWWQVDGPGGAEPKVQRPLALSAMDFQLSDHDGNRVGPASLIGRPSMVFFGFTYCPDVCPTTLSDISGWLDDLGDEAAEMNVVFVTVDPERDTVDSMAEYVSYFHPTVRGWTGQKDEIAKAARGFGASYKRMPTEDGDYTMNHTASVFLFDATGQFTTMIDYHEPREYAVPKIRRALANETEGAA